MKNLYCFFIAISSCFYLCALDTEEQLSSSDTFSPAKVTWTLKPRLISGTVCLSEAIAKDSLIIQNQEIVLKFSSRDGQEKIGTPNRYKKIKTGFSPRSGVKAFLSSTPSNKDIYGVKVFLKSYGYPADAPQEITATGNLTKRKRGEGIAIEILEPANLLDSEQTEFTHGIWCYVNSTEESDSLAIDCGDKIFDDIADSLHIHQKNSIEDVIKAVVDALHENLETLKKTVFLSASCCFCCKYYSLWALPIFARLLKNENLNLSGTVHFVVADMVDKNLFPKEEGHCWNLLRLDNGVLIYIDVSNRAFIVLSSTFFSRLSLWIHDEGSWRRQPLEARPFFKPWVRETINMFVSKKHLYQDAEQRLIGAQKLLSQIIPPQEEITLRRYDPSKIGDDISH